MRGDFSISETDEDQTPSLPEKMMGIGMLSGSLVLFPTVDHLPQEFYVFMRAIAFLFSSACAFWSFTGKHFNWIIFSVAGIISFNPIFPMLGDENWDVFGMFFAIGFFIIGLRLIDTKIATFGAAIFGALGFILIFLTLHVNYNMPRGPKYPSGEIVCANDGRGPCGEKMIEDLSDLDIPEWAKFLRQNALWTMLFFGGSTVFLANKRKRIIY